MKNHILKIIITSFLASMFSTADAYTIDCSEAYNTETRCEIVTCPEKYKSFIGTWTGPFESYVQELSSEEKTVFRPYKNTITYSEDDCLMNIENGDTFIIGRKIDTYPPYLNLPNKESTGLLITGRKTDGTPFLRTNDQENGLYDYQLVYQNKAANMSIWQLTIPASADSESPELQFTTIDNQDFLETSAHKRNVTVTMSIGPVNEPFWSGIIVKGFHSLIK
jgi:hypothetical protein